MSLIEELKRQNDIQVDLSKTNLKKSKYLIWTENGGCNIFIDDVGNEFVPKESYKNEIEILKRQMEILKNKLKLYEK